MKQGLILILFSFFVKIVVFANDGSSLWLSHYALPRNVVKMIRTDMYLGEGFKLRISSPEDITIMASNGKGMLYGEMAVKRLIATGKIHEGMDSICLTSQPSFRYRILNHWNNLDGTIERGYAGKSIFWNNKLKGKEYDKKIRSYAFANASIGINGVVLNNVNASPEILTKTYLDSVRHIADLLRPYYIKVYLSVNFGSPKALGQTATADPLNPDVVRWWRRKVRDIYKRIPDFGGFLVKANSEGQPGPFDYGRTHADGANMLADALRPFGGIVMWRSFVYGARHKGEDRVMQAVSEFKNLDGKFHDNVILQSKNGPLDFQPREPYAPIFDNMHSTKQMAEFQITQEYTGQAKHLVYLAPMWKEFFEYVSPDSLLGIAGVSNVGDDSNWCGHDFSQANWYAFGRLAWNPSLSAEEIADEWLRLTFSCDSSFIAPVKTMMLRSREDCVNYMMPLGLHHIFAFDHHYGPQPDGFKAEYPLEWCPVYYHKADSVGLGFDRSSTGSNAVSQYREPYRSLFDNLETCPEKYLLWFHHVPWNYEMRNGLTLWDNLKLHYCDGVDAVEKYQDVWDGIKDEEIKSGDKNGERWWRISQLLKLQAENARAWRDTCLGYFAHFREERK